MSYINKKERREIYLKAAKFFSGGSAKRQYQSFGLAGFCDYLELKLKEKKGTLKDYPEYAMFKPFLVPIDFKYYWFDDNKDRVEALQLAAKLCTMTDTEINEFFVHLQKTYSKCENLPLAFTKWKQSKK